MITRRGCCTSPISSFDSMQHQQKFASNIAVESEFFMHFSIRREMFNSPFFTSSHSSALCELSIQR